MTGRRPDPKRPKVAKAYFRRNARRARWGKRLRRPGFYLKSALWVVGLAGVLLIGGIDVFIALAGAKHAGGCRVVSVTDGDTVRLYCPGRGVQNARLLGFDTPEVFSPECRAELWKGLQATWTLRGLLLRAQKMGVVREGTDKYGRALVFLSLDGVPLARRMIGAGQARPYDGGPRGTWCFGAMH